MGMPKLIIVVIAFIPVGLISDGHRSFYLDDFVDLRVYAAASQEVSAVDLPVKESQVNEQDANDGGNPQTKSDFVDIIKVNKLLFSSCVDGEVSDQTEWEGLDRENADVWISLGDFGYAATPTIEDIKKAGQSVSSSKQYQEFVRKLKLTASTWDDHDYGLNDGGKDFALKKESANAFFEFWQIPLDSPRRNRSGIYFSRLIMPNQHATPDKSIKLILLDTRYNRDNPIVHQFSHSNARIWGIINGALRYFGGVLGLTKYNKGDILGEEQWQWLTEQLSSRDAVMTIICTSIRVFGRVAYEEGWSHYPRALERLQEVIKNTKPKNLLLLSGDVHYGTMEVFPGCIVEACSSGITHSVADHLGFNLLHHLATSGSEDGFSEAKIVQERNYGSIKFGYNPETQNLQSYTITIHAINGAARLIHENTIYQESQGTNWQCLDLIQPISCSTAPLFLLGILVVLSMGLVLFAKQGITRVLKRKMKTS